MSALPAGSIAYFLSFNHDTERFEIIASGHVTDDGSTIVTDAGGGLSIAGWGCNCPPYSVTAECKSDKCKDDPEIVRQINALRAERDAALATANDLFNHGAAIGALMLGRDGSTPFRNFRTNYVICTTSLGPIAIQFRRVALVFRFTVVECIAALVEPTPFGEVGCLFLTGITLGQIEGLILLTGPAIPTCRGLIRDVRAALAGAAALERFAEALIKVGVASAAQARMLALCPELAIDPAFQAKIAALRAQVDEVIQKITGLKAEGEQMIRELENLISAAETIADTLAGWKQQIEDIIRQIEEVFNVFGTDIVEPKIVP